jgi:phosphate transport system permease protein
MPALKTASTRRAKRRDRLARWVITLGGVAVIASVVAILAMIAGVTLPMFRSPRASLVDACPIPKSLPVSKVLRLGIDMDLNGIDLTGFVWLSNGTVAWVDLPTGRLVGRQRLDAPGKDAQGALDGVESLGSGKYALAWSSGAASLVEIVSQAGNSKTEARAAAYSVRSLANMPAAKHRENRPKIEQVLIRRSNAGALTRITRFSDATIAICRETTTETLTGDDEVAASQTEMRDDVLAHVRAMTMDHEGGTLYAGTDDGRLIRWQLDAKGEVAQREVVRAFPDRRAVTALALVLGDVSLAVGDAEGGLTTWSPVSADGSRKLKAIHRLRRHQSPIREIVPSRRDKSILSLSVDGVVHFDHMTSERPLLSISSDQDHPLHQVALGPRGDALIGLDDSGTLTAWRIDGGCPEISLKTLFGKVLYEGYDTPSYAWQTTGGEDFEPKYSLVPLVFGTLKGTFYAMFFAAPLALFGAMYVSYFATPGFRRTIKPMVEIMATVPSVVIGFLIALWLAPVIERWIVAFFTSLVAVPATFAVFMIAWQLLRRFDWARRVENGYEFLVVLPVLLVGVGLAACLASPLETWFFGGNFRRWLFAGPLAMPYDQRNSIIIAFGLGFTVIPIIFSIAEDALSNVPYSMTAASMAVGASRWQTLWRVVLPSASPGIFAAMMIGFGRAVGETMIVLMATGNTPILDWSPLNGMRTLSANIAVEISEAPVGGTLYRVLFLCAILLFLMTFTVNTAAELVRQRLRKRFGRF